ncbi:hypothetical protein BGZ46_006530 [Entomortierella lignicola]|nr:hypothetical protein BGZ46_006530 [Entomortierella lignicola]
MRIEGKATLKTKDNLRVMKASPLKADSNISLFYKESGKVPGKRRKVIPKLTQGHCKFMENYPDNKPLSTLREVHKELHDKFPAVHVSLSRVYNYVTNTSDNKA